MVPAFPQTSELNMLLSKACRKRRFRRPERSHPFPAISHLPATLVRSDRPRRLSGYVGNLPAYLFSCILMFFTLAAPSHPADRRTGPVVLEGGSGKIIENLEVTSTTGDCLIVNNATDLTIRASQIGPCKGNGIVVHGGTRIKIYDNYIHPEGSLASCCDNTDGILAKNVTDLSIQGNVVAWGESNIEIQNTTRPLIRGNFMFNPRNAGSRGTQIQCVNCTDGVIEDNYTKVTSKTESGLVPAQEDAISVIAYKGVSKNMIVRYNYVTGGNSDAGCGINADAGADGTQILNNTLVDTGQCGIFVCGTHSIVSGNRVLNRTPVKGGGNTAISVWRFYSELPCGPVTVSDNIIAAKTLSGNWNSYWNGGGCDPVSLKGNVLNGAAKAMLEPAERKLRPPQIPPEPVLCVIASPYTNHTGLSKCGAPNG
jgi:hypothetical protein